MKTQRTFPFGALLLVLIVLSPLGDARCTAAGYALQFTNSSIQAVGIPFVPELNLYPFTLTAWIKAGAQPSDGFEATPILSKGNAQFDGWIVSIYNGDIRAKYVANSGSSYVSDGLPNSSSGLNGGGVGDDQWHHVAFTVDATGGRIYVDGVLRTNTAWFGTPMTNQLAHPIYFGHGAFSGAQYVGLLDEVTLWNTALTQAQIQTNKNRMLTGFETNLIAYYRLDESVGPHSLDSAPAGGTNTGFWNNVTAVLSDSPIARIPTVQTLPASAVGGTSATLNGLANPSGTNTSAWFEWGTTTSYGNTTPAVPLPALTNDLPFPQGITGLAVGTTYHFRGVASNSFGLAWGTNSSFTTATGPSVTTLPASGVSGGNATLNGLVNPNGDVTSAWFEWGTTTNYGNTTAAQSLGNGTSNTNTSQNLPGLSGATYHFRAVASNALGIVTGTNLSFTTPIFSLVVTNLPGVFDSSAAWGDYDNDGRLDLILTGTTNGDSFGSTSQLWRNTGNGFTHVPIAGLPGVYRGSVAWGDYDNDGRLDFLLSGEIWFGGAISQLWRNTGSGFTNVPIAGLPDALNSSVAWGDYDNDGRLDFILTGNSFGGFIFQLWRNTGSGFANVTGSVPGVSRGSVAWGDYDNDGRLDFFLSGDTDSWGPYAQLWRNTGSGFTEFPIAGLSQVVNSSVSWGDYDNDGRLDFILAGDTESYGLVSQLWRNTGSGFSNVTASVVPNLAPVYDSSVAWGDYDNDGRLDFLLTGTTNISGSGLVSQLWRNSGSGFTNVLIPGLPSVGKGSVAWGDYDNDGRLDFLLTGTNGIRISQLWRNNTPGIGTPPDAPSGLTASTSNNAIVFTWNAATDAQTPGVALTYNLRIGTAPESGDLVGPTSAPDGWRRLPAAGNAGQRLFRTIYGLPIGRPIYWSVQAVDTSFAGSAFASDTGFALNITPPNGTSSVPGDTSGDGIVSETELNSVLANYFPTSPWLQMTNVAGLGGTNVTFALTNSVAGAFSVEYSTNLANWNYLGPAIPRYLFTDTNAPALPQRYYRLRWP
jgi:hypothetical protein